MNERIHPAADRRRERILDAALKAALTYGYARTTMDDIARAVEMSRPALYLLFRNKTEIYREIAGNVMARSIEAARAALSGTGGFVARMEAAVDAAIFECFGEVAASPHGVELLGMKTALAGDLVDAWRADIIAFLAGAVAGHAARNDLDLAAAGLDAEGIAAMLLDALEGMRSRSADFAAQRAAAFCIIRVIDRALRR